MIRTTGLGQHLDSAASWDLFSTLTTNAHCDPLVLRTSFAVDLAASSFSHTRLNRFIKL
jgi:hypothetical protein